MPELDYIVLTVCCPTCSDIISVSWEAKHTTGHELVTAAHLLIDKHKRPPSRESKPPNSKGGGA